jgi:hypothetical protein
MNANYQEGIAELAQFHAELQKKLESVTDENEPSLDESLAWSSRLDKIMASIYSNDLAYLLVEETLAHTSKLATSTGNSTPCVLQGFPTIEAVPPITDNLPAYELVLRGTLLPAHSGSVDGASIAAANAQIEYQSAALWAPTSLACFDSLGNLLGIAGTGEVQGPSLDSLRRIVLVECTRFW